MGFLNNQIKKPIPALFLVNEMHPLLIEAQNQMLWKLQLAATIMMHRNHQGSTC
jgi:hypothetical protein